MVDDYHLERDAQLRRKESLDRRDEIDRLIVFKDWLRAYEWDSQRPIEDVEPVDADDDWAATIPAQRGWADPVAVARRAVDAVPDLVDSEELDPRASVDACTEDPILEIAS